MGRGGSEGGSEGGGVEERSGGDAEKTISEGAGGSQVRLSGTIIIWSAQFGDLRNLKITQIPKLRRTYIYTVGWVFTACVYFCI